MALKYFLEYQDFANVNHRLEINQPDETLGPNLVTNGKFGTDTAWTKGTGWTIADGVAEVVSSQEYLTQDSFTYLNGRTYEVQYDIVEITQGQMRIRFFGTVETSLATKTSAGRYIDRITLTEDKTELRVGYRTTDASFIVDNISVREVITAGASQEIQGKVMLDNGSIENPLEAIRGQGLRIELEADTGLTFNDLYSEEEQTFSVIYERDSVVLFNGWLNPEGLFQDFVNDKWNVGLDCVDGLSFLENLSFVQDTGLFFTGKLSELDIITNCLRRTGVLQNINISIDVFYEGLADTVSIVENVFLNSNRFVKDDNGTIMSCEEVLKDTLEPYGASITSLNGEWYIFKSNQLFNNSEQTYFRYDSDGVALEPTTQLLDITQPLGSQINSFYPHHAGANQSMGIKRSIGAYRISYKYGLVKSLIDNIYLFTPDGLTIADWTVDSLTNMTLPSPSGNGVTFATSNAGASVVNLTSDSFNLPTGSSTTLVVRYTTDFLPQGFAQFKFQVAYTETGTPFKTFYLNNANEWIYDSPSTFLTNFVGGTNGTFSIDIAPTPNAAAGDSGDLFIIIWTPFFTNFVTNLTLQEVSLSPSQNSTSSDNKVGEFHTFQRTDKPSAKVEDTKEVFNGDNVSDIYIGTIYKADETTPTETWFRKGFTEDKPLLQIMGEETLRMSASPAIIFSGSIYGYIPYFSVVSIDGISGVFMFIEYSYDTLANMITCKMIQLYGSELDDIDYQTNPDYGKTVKPTIIG